MSRVDDDARRYQTLKQVVAYLCIPGQGPFGFLWSAPGTDRNGQLVAPPNDDLDRVLDYIHQNPDQITIPPTAELHAAACANERATQP